MVVLAFSLASVVGQMGSFRAPPGGTPLEKGQREIKPSQHNGRIVRIYLPLNCSASEVADSFGMARIPHRDLDLSTCPGIRFVHVSQNDGELPPQLVKAVYNCALELRLQPPNMKVDPKL